MTHPSQSLDEVVHQRHRLGILTVLAEGKRVQFGFLQDLLGLTDGNLSRHLQILEEAGYVAIEKGYEGKRPRTWATITKSGRRALDAEMRILSELLHHAGDQKATDTLRPSRSPKVLAPRPIP